MSTTEFFSVDGWHTKLRNTWCKQKVQVFIMLVLSSHIILIIFGSRRKYMVSGWIKILVWSAYMGANSLAIVALSNNRDHFEDDSLDEKSPLQALWSPFLLLHLGGPNTISAYSLEDNELWLRTFLGFIVQVSGVFYLFLLSCCHKTLTFIFIPIFISGIIKYGERAFVLWTSSTERFKESLLSDPDPYPDLVKITKQDMEKRLEKVDFDIERERVDDESQEIFEAFFLFKRFAHLFAGLILDDHELLITYKIFCQKLAEDAFKLAAIELGIMYDLLYTKAAIVYSRLGIVFRCISFVSSISALIIFSTSLIRQGYILIDIIITVSLLVVWVVLEVYAVIELCFSDWATIIHLTKFENALPKISYCRSFFANRKRWSEAMGQFNLIGYCFKDVSARLIRVQNLPFIKKSLKNSLYLSWKDVSVDLKKMIFKELLEKIVHYKLRDHFCETHLLKKILGQRGDYVLEERYKLTDFDWCTKEVEFDHSLLLWHIATDLCYYEDIDKHGGANDLDPNRKIGKCLSDYMLYLLVVCPYMMPKGIGELRFRDTCAKVKMFFESSKATSTSIQRIDDCKMLLENNIDYLIAKDMSVLVEGCNLAKKLQSLESKDCWSYEKKWNLITEVWVEMLAYAANDCEWIQHGYQLRKGGELLTHVRLVMIHLGLSEQYNKNGRIID